MKILVTGATGLLGSERTRQLVADGADVRILRRATSKLDLLGDVADQVEHAVGDVNDVERLQAAMADVRQVYHVATFVGFGGRRDRERLRRVNVVGTANVVNAALAAGVERLVHTSSMAAFGRPEDATQTIDETSEWRASRMNTAYAESKYLAELEVFRGIAEGLDAVIVNPALIFGLGRPGEGTMQIAQQVRDGRLPAVPTGGTNVVDVIDVAAGHRLAMARGETGERYFLGSENLTWRAIIGTLAEAFGVAPPRRTLSPTLALTAGTLAEAFAFVTGSRPRLTRETARTASRFYRYSNQKAIEELGCSFRPFEETALRMAQGLGNGAVPH
ncbi:MAG: NAD-dependent epimerase/dehydratase family protein [Rhodothermales bacterium]